MISKIFAKWSLMIFLFMPSVIAAQLVTQSVVIANGGEYSNPNDYVTINIYDPENHSTTYLATIFSQSVQGLLVHEGFAYMAAQDSLVKINIVSGERVAAIELSGVNKFGFYQDRLIVTRQYPVTSGFVQIRNLSDLSLIKTFDQISDESYDVMVVADTAYISVKGGWLATVGKLAVLDMKNEAFVREVNFGPSTVGISNIFKDESDLYFVCKTPYMGNSGSILKYNLSTTFVSISTFQHVIGEPAGIKYGKLYVKIDGNIGTINLSNMEIVDLYLITDNFPTLDITACALDVVNDLIYVSFSYWIAPNGTGRIFDLSGNETGSYEVGIASEYLAINYLDVTQIQQFSDKDSGISLFPNPCHDELFLTFQSENPVTISIFDISGKEVISSGATQAFVSPIDVSFLRKGLYFIKYTVDNQNVIMKFVKQ